MQQDLSNIVITRIHSCNHVQIRSNYKYCRKNRECHSLVHKISGKTVYTTDNGTYISDSKHICLLPKGSDYSLVNIIPGDFIQIEFQAEIPEETHDIVTFTLNNPDELTKLFRKIEYNMTLRQSNYHIACMGMLYQILHIILKQNSNGSFVDRRSAALLKPAIDYIEENLDSGKIENETLSELCGISCVYFRKLFTKTYHTSPNAYIKQLRIQKAQGILLSDYESIEQIAYNCGFSTVYYFSKVFKDSTGFTPTEYARQKKNKFNA